MILKIVTWFVSEGEKSLERVLIVKLMFSMTDEVNSNVYNTHTIYLKSAIICITYGEAHMSQMSHVVIFQKLLRL